MSRTIRTPKIYKSRREFIKAVTAWRRDLDFTTNPTPGPNHFPSAVSAISTLAEFNRNPWMATMTIAPDTMRTDKAIRAASRTTRTRTPTRSTR